MDPVLHIDRTKLAPLADGAERDKSSVPPLHTRELSPHIRTSFISPDSVTAANGKEGWFSLPEQSVKTLGSARIEDDTLTVAASGASELPALAPSSSARTTISVPTAKRRIRDSHLPLAFFTAATSLIDSSWLKSAVDEDSWNYSDESDEAALRHGEARGAECSECDHLLCTPSAKRRTRYSQPPLEFFTALGPCFGPPRSGRRRRHRPHPHHQQRVPSA